MVLEPEVACRTEPDRDSAAVQTLPLGYAFIVRASVRGPTGGAEWYAANQGRDECWVPGPLTVPFDYYRDPDRSLLAIAEHALQLGEDAAFEHLAAIDNLLVERTRFGFRRSHAPPEDVPPILQLRHLEILNRAAGALGHSGDVRGDPLKHAWVLGHPELRYFEPGARYYVPGERFWRLYEQHAASTEADLIAWTAAEMPVYVDECYAQCLLDRIARPYMRYWEAFPRGSRLLEALAAGMLRAEQAASYCVLISTGSLRYGNRDRLGTLVEEYRASLLDVSAPEKDELLELLAVIGRTCVEGNVRTLQDPAAIPGLARALPLRRSTVNRSLASFGEDAAPTVLDSARSTDKYTVEAALDTLRLLVEGNGANTLSAETLGEIRGVAERWLTESAQSIGTLGSAIELAMALADPELSGIVESLAASPDEVAARGIESSWAIEWIQKQAAEGLAGAPRHAQP